MRIEQHPLFGPIDKALRTALPASTTYEWDVSPAFDMDIFWEYCDVFLDGTHVVVQVNRAKGIGVSANPPGKEFSAEPDTLFGHHQLDEVCVLVAKLLGCEGNATR